MMASSRLGKRIGWVIATIATLAPLGAVPRPPFELRDRAPEQLMIEVVSVTVHHESSIEVEAQARIVGVTKSSGGLKAGQLIPIHYVTYPRPTNVGTCATPQMPVLIKNRQYKVYLEKVSQDTFGPAASYISFEGV